jgi:hypothetical protein
VASPIEFAAAILRFLHMKKPKLRVIVGHDLKQKSSKGTCGVLKAPIFHRRSQILCTTLVLETDFFLARNLLGDFHSHHCIMRKTENALR